MTCVDFFGIFRIDYTTKMDCSFVNVIKKSTISHLCWAITFFTSGLIINFAQLILYCTLRLYSKKLYRNVNWYLSYSVHSQLVFIGEWWSNSKVILYVDREDFERYFGKEHAYLIMNHAYEIEGILGWIILERVGILGNAKAYCKKAIQYMPVLGWNWKFSEFVFLERNFEKDKRNIDIQISELCDYPDPMWLILYPEGTRFTQEKHKVSLEFARKHNQPELKHHLLPRTKGFRASLPAMRGKVPAIYDCLLEFKVDDPVEPMMRNILMGKSVTAHFYLRRIPLDQIPETEEGMDKFLKDLFVVKDKMKEGFIQHGDFFRYTENLPRYEPLETKRRYFTLIHTLGWSFIVLVPMISYLVKLLFSGQLVYLSIALGIIGLFYFLLQRLLSMSDIKKSSAYGTNLKNK